MSRGRGRGRGRGKASYEAALGLAPGEAAPPPILQPPPLFPQLDRRPLKLKDTAEENYLVSIKQGLRQHMLESSFHLSHTHSTVMKIVRYSDKYRRNGDRNGQFGWGIDWKYFPSELQPGGKKSPRVTKKTKVKSGKRKRDASSDITNDRTAGGDSEGDFPKPKKSRRRVTFDDDEDNVERGERRKGGEEGGEMVKKLESLEKAEQVSGESEQSGGEEEEELYNEEEEEEGTDYNLTYFDNGEDYEPMEDDALEEGPVY